MVPFLDFFNLNRNFLAVLFEFLSLLLIEVSNVELQGLIGPPLVLLDTLKFFETKLVCKLLHLELAVLEHLSSNFFFLLLHLVDRCVLETYLGCLHLLTSNQVFLDVPDELVDGDGLAVIASELQAVLWRLLDGTHLGRLVTQVFSKVNLGWRWILYSIQVDYIHV